MRLQMLDPELKIDLIIKEFKRRLWAEFPSIPIYEGSGGVWGIWNQNLPCLHIFELMTVRQSSPTRNKGIYLVTQPVQIEYVSKLVDRVNMYTEGRSKKLRIQKALELDERFVQNKGVDGLEGQDLLIAYSMKFDETVEVIPNTVDCAVQYEIQYTERFFGYNR